MLRIRLVDPDQHALLVLTHVGVALEVDDHGHFRLQRSDFGDRFRQKVVVLEGRHRKVEPDHAAELLGP